VLYPLPALAEEPELQELSERPSAVPPPAYPEALCSASAEEHLQSLERKHLLERLQAEVFQLPEPYRTVLLLRYWERWQWSYIAGQLHVSRQTLHRWHTHALELLRCKLHAFWNG
jgi:DNA-directed RNA polymerase specialized sigma24 family protein